MSFPKSKTTSIVNYIQISSIPVAWKGKRQTFPFIILIGLYTYKLLVLYEEHLTCLVFLNTQKFYNSKAHRLSMAERKCKLRVIQSAHHHTYTIIHNMYTYMYYIYHSHIGTYTTQPEILMIINFGRGKIKNKIIDNKAVKPGRAWNSI